ncbi:MAG: hypothetical protein P4L92_09010 [Rudaea sp.]|nr:hypothetical protein [Rudaea sp.]
MNATIPVPSARRSAGLAMLLLGASLGCTAAGIPKSTPQNADAQFGGQCVEALASGHHTMTDCSVNWTAKDGKLYCFKDAAAKTAFLANPAEALERARSFIAAGNVQSTEQAMQDFEGSDAEMLVKRYIQNRSGANAGIFALEDPLTGEHLDLVYDDIDFTRTIDGYGFFPDVKFHERKDAQKKYLIDFWVLPQNGQLLVQETRIYKAPMQVEGAWTLVTRQPVPWWWIPASEHPGHVAQKRGWEVMSAVEQDVLRQSLKGNGVFNLKDEKTGKDLQLSFIDTHQPIRQLDDNGHYFACTDFRAVGTRDQIYDIDFWLSEKNGAMTVDQVRVHKVPELKDGHWIQVPRYSFKDLGDSHVVP